MPVVLREAESTQLESPSRFTGLRQTAGNRIIAANNPIWPTGPLAREPTLKLVLFNRDDRVMPVVVTQRTVFAIQAGLRILMKHYTVDEVRQRLPGA